MESFSVIFVNQTDRAILVYDVDPDDAFWLPKSAIEFDETEVNCAKTGDDIEINVPEWLAKEEGLL